MIDNRFNTAALAATRTERNTASSRRNDSTITAAMNSGRRAEMLSVWSTYEAVIPPTTTSRSVPASASGTTSSRSTDSRSVVAWSCGLAAGVSVMTAASALGLAIGGDTAATPGVEASVACRSASVAIAASSPLSATSTKVPLNPAPNPSVIRS